MARTCRFRYRARPLSYVVFARKYRPQRFADMIGQEHIARTLGNAIAQDRVHHAYLFAGARGLGKTTTARILAKGLVCERGPTAEPCNECRECSAVNEGHSVDVVEIDGASNNSVDNIRNLREQVNYLPQTARRKVYIIDEVHMLSTSAFNALLKTLEEPPPHVNFVFATTEPQKVLPTILSRVNRLDFHRVSVEGLVGHLEHILNREGAAVEPGGLRIVARAAGGSVRDALTLLDQVIAFADDSSKVTETEVRSLLGRADRAAVAELVDAILDRDPAETIRRFDALITAGHDVTVLSMQLLEHLRDLTVLKVCGTRAILPDATDSELETLQGQMAKADGSWLGQLFDRFSRVIDRLQTSRVQRMLVEMGLLDLASTEPMIPLGDLVERLNGGGPGGGGGGTRSGGGGRNPGRAAPRGGRSTAPGGEASPPLNASPPRTVPPQSPATRPKAADREVSQDGATPQPSSADQVGQADGEVSVGSPDGADGARVSRAPEPNVTPAATRPSFGDSPFAAQLWQMSEGVVAAHAKAAAVSETGAAPRSEAPAVTQGSPRLPPTTPPQFSPASQSPAPDSSHRAATACVGPSPCEPAPPADGVIPWESLHPFQAWELLLGRIRLGDEFQCAVLEQLGLLGLTEGTLHVAAPRGSFSHVELSQHPERRAQLEQAMRDHFGAPFALKLVEGEPALPDAPSVVLVQQQRREEHRVVIEAEARSHPALCNLIKTFSGELTRIRPLSDF